MSASEFTIFAVDDNLVARTLATKILGAHFTVEGFASGTECLQRLTDRTPDLILLDVEMPDMDGYTLCREIKNQPSCGSVPVLFVSAHDDLESRVKGFDAGGHDFIIKPINPAELLRKVELIVRMTQERDALRRQAEESETLSSLVMSNLDEYSLLIGFLRKLNACDTRHAVCDALFDLLRSFRLDGLIQFRLGGQETTRNASGEGSPLEASIFNHLRSMGCIVQFRNRLAVNYDTLSVLVNNMPQNDAELCGRLRDHLAIAAESADAKLRALSDRRNISAGQQEVADLIELVNATLLKFKSGYVEARERGSHATELIIEEFNSILVGMAMTDGQEEALQRTIRAGLEELAGWYDLGKETEETFGALTDKLQHTLTVLRG